MAYVLARMGGRPPQHRAVVRPIQIRPVRAGSSLSDAVVADLGDQSRNAKSADDLAARLLARLGEPRSSEPVEALRARIEREVAARGLVGCAVVALAGKDLGGNADATPEPRRLSDVDLALALVLLSKASDVVWVARKTPIIDRETLGRVLLTSDPRFVSGNISAPEPVSMPPAAPAGASRGFVLNPRLTFNTFDVGSSNQFAHAAARAVGESLSRAYNPLFLYGGVGLGKTHLMHAIAHQVLSRRPNTRVLYLSAETFLNDLINARLFERMNEFKQRYRELDVLLMDDVQLIAGKDWAQEEFFHTFNALHDAQKQIVLTSDALPKEIPALEERLRFCFERGLIADIQPPSLEMKVAILRKKAEAEKIELPNDVALYIATSVKSNARELEGRLNRVVAFASLTGKALSVELARETLKDILGTEESRAVPAEISRV